MLYNLIFTQFRTQTRSRFRRSCFTSGGYADEVASPPEMEDLQPVAG